MNSVLQKYDSFGNDLGIKQIITKYLKGIVDCVVTKKILQILYENIWDDIPKNGEAKSGQKQPDIIYLNPADKSNVGKVFGEMYFRTLSTTLF